MRGPRMLSMGRSQNIDIGGVLATGRELVVDDAVEVPDFGSFVFPEPARVAARLRRIERGLEIAGTLDVVYEGPCDRCLEDVRRTLHLDIAESFVPGHDSLDPWGEANIVQGDQLDLADLIRQLIDAALPLVLVCEEACPGLCQRCGMRATSPPCACPPHDEKEIHG